MGAAWQRHLTLLAACVGSGFALPAGAASEVETKLAYLGVAGDYWQLVVREGGQDRVVTRSPRDKTRCSWFPDGKAVLVSSQDGVLLRVDLASGREEEIPLPMDDAFDAVVSPDGAWIALSSSPADSRDDNEIWLLRADGSGLRKLTHAPGLQHHPAWSPDGQWIYYLSGLLGEPHHEVWRMRPDGTRQEALTAGRGYHFDVAVAADGRFAFSNNRSGDYQIFVQEPTGALRAVTSDPGFDAYPVWSPDGRRLVFESARTGELQLFEIDADGGEATQITHGDGARRAAWWSGASP
ncbi:MAG: hypothetical protein MJE66_15665 [Proteobacteria bacterium]|nr:hypothetical protein [Pseudomonadota bacterium]